MSLFAALKARRHARWRRKVHYPAAGTRYVSSESIDFLSDLRGLSRTLVLIMVGFIGFVVLTLTGFTPSWMPQGSSLSSLLAVIGVWSMPQARRGFRIVTWQTLRPRQAAAWEDSGLSALDLPKMTGSPLTPQAHRAYVDAACAYTLDPRLSWGLYERNVSPAAMARIRLALGGGLSSGDPSQAWPPSKSVEVAIHLADLGVTVEELEALGEVFKIVARTHATSLQMARVLHGTIQMLAGPRFSHHPDTFEAGSGPGPPAPVSSWKPVLAAWTAHISTTSLLLRLDTTQAEAHTMGDWFVSRLSLIEGAGCLASAFESIDMDPIEARAAVAANPGLTADQIRLLGLLRP